MNNSHAHSEHGDHKQAHAEHNHGQDFLRRFYVSLFFTFFVLLLSPDIQRWLNIPLPDFTGRQILLFILASVVAIYGAWPFYKDAVSEIKHRRPGMMTLVALAVAAGYLYSAIAPWFIENGLNFYWEISTLVVVLLFGHWLEAKAMRGAKSALEEINKLIPEKANLIQNGQIKEIFTHELKVGDKILVRPGEKISADGKVVEGISSVNEAIITGESKPITKQTGGTVIAGAINIDGSLTIEVTKVGEDTTVAGVKRLVEHALRSRPAVQRLADKAAGYLTFTAVGAAIITILIWTILLNQPFGFAITLAITVIVIACPHALGLAIPTVTSTAASTAAKNGILIKDMSALETAEKADYVVFDKTGTLTEGQFAVTDIEAVNGYDENKLYSLALSLARRSSHPVSKAIAAALEKSSAKPIPLSDFQELPGRGIRATMEHLRILLGNQALMAEFHVSTDDVSHLTRAFFLQGKSISFLAVGAEVKGVFALSDKIRKEAEKAVRNLKKMGLKVAMLTGDNKATADYVARILGLDQYYANLKAEQKIEKIKDLQNTGHRVIMVGDGINDAPALIQSDVGIAIGAGTDIAQESAKVILVTSNPLNVARFVSLAQKTKTKMKQNLFWATAYNIVAIPAAAGVFMPLGIILRPEWGALAMSASSVIVVANALTLRREKLE